MVEYGFQLHNFGHLQRLSRNAKQVHEHNLWDNVQVVLPTATAEQVRDLHAALAEEWKPKNPYDPGKPTAVTYAVESDGKLHYFPPCEPTEWSAWHFANAQIAQQMGHSAQAPFFIYNGRRTDMTKHAGVMSAIVAQIQRMGIEAIVHRNALDGTEHIWRINPPKAKMAASKRRR